MSRALSYTEVSTAMTCQARHAFAYTGHLTHGETLHRRAIAPRLSSGRAWGAAVAAWHAFSQDDSLLGVYHPMMAKIAAQHALRASYASDIAEQQDSGVRVDPELQIERELWLAGILDHYMATAPKLSNLERLEGEIDVPLPSRTGRQASSLYRFTGYVDGVEVQPGSELVLEFKLRDQLTPVPMIELGRQIRYYAYSRQRATGVPVVGVVVDERLSQAPKPARLVQSQRKSEGINGMVPSHAVNQLCTPESYVALCEEFDVKPHPDTVAALTGRVWQQRVPIMFGPSELEEAGRELVSAAETIRDLDSGQRYPVRNGQIHICRGCRFKDICSHPNDDLYVDTLFERRVPKRLKPPKPVEQASGKQDSDGGPGTDANTLPLRKGDVGRQPDGPPGRQSPAPAEQVSRETELDGPPHTPAPEPGTADTPAPDPQHCERCGMPIGYHGRRDAHGPGFCLDRRTEPSTPAPPVHLRELNEVLAELRPVPEWRL